MIIFVRSILTALLTSLLIQSLAAAAIVGSDDRRMLTPQSPEYNLGSAIALGVLSSLIEPSTNPGYHQIPMADVISDMLCPSEQLSGYFPSIFGACTGFLVAPDLLVTAGHCAVNQGQVENESGMYCEAYSPWMFDYVHGTKGYSFQKNSNGGHELQNIPQKNLFYCKKILFAINDDSPGGGDFALIQLDRPVTNRVPLKLASKPPRAGESLRLIGFPMGLPAVLSANGRAAGENDGRHILALMDVLEGNSGSPVFNDQNEVVGLLSGGSPSTSFYKKPGQSCFTVTRCDQNGLNCTSPQTSAETKAWTYIQPITPVIEILKKLNP